MEEHISNKQRRHLKRKALELLDEKETVKLVLEDCLMKIERKETEGSGKNKKTNKRQKLEHNNDDNNEGNTKKKMLLILDVNKVLVYRLKGSSFFTPRPHVHEFLQLMSKHYNLALWTSMQKLSSKKVLKELFHDRNVRLEFTWFQNRCKIIKSFEQQEKDEKPSFFKNLIDVWQEYPVYNTSNTVRTLSLLLFPLNLIFDRFFLMIVKRNVLRMIQRIVYILFHLICRNQEKKIKNYILMEGLHVI